MEYTSPLISTLQRAVDLTRSSPEDGLLTIPPLIQPIVQIPRETFRHNPAGNPTMRTSFGAESSFSRLGAGGGITTEVARWGYGIWDLVVQLTLGTNFSQNYANPVQLNLTIVPPDNVGFDIANLYASANQAQTIQWRQRLHCQRISGAVNDYWKMSFTTAATVAGDELGVQCCLTAALLT